MRNVLITGASGGIGYEFCKQYQSKGFTVFAVCRNASSELEKLGVNVISNIDLAHEYFCSALVEKLSEKKIDLLINNAGIYLKESFGSFKETNLHHQFQINTIAPLMLTEKLLSHLHEKSKVIMISSRMGSISDNESGGSYGYRASKAALNAVAKSLSVDLKKRGIAVGVFHPGYVKTKMTNYKGFIEAQQSVSAMIKQIEELTLDAPLTLQHMDGSTLSW